MGYELAKAAMLRGAEVTLVSGVTSLAKPMFIDYVQVRSAGDMFEAMKERFRTWELEARIRMNRNA